MIKSLLDDEEPNDDAGDGGGGFLRRRREKREFLTIDLAEEPEEAEDELRSVIRGDAPLSIAPDPPPADAVRPDPTPPSPESGFAARTDELERKLKEIEEELRREKERFAEQDAPAVRPEAPPAPQAPAVVEPLSPTIEPSRISVPFGGDLKDDFVPDSSSETFRKSGLAWSAGIALFGSVVFMLVLGWFADLLIGSSPWGIVAGIVIGSVVGFLQFFRITSQILKPGKSDFEKVSLRSSVDEPERGEEPTANGPGILG